MDRKKALATATAVTAVVAAATLAIGANLGILGIGNRERAGRMSPVESRVVTSPSPKVVTVFVDETTPPAPRRAASTASSSEPEIVETVVETERPAAVSPEPTHSEDPEHEVENETEPDD